MKSLKNFLANLIEEKNVHMEHIEDLIFNEGVDGTRRAINYLRDLRNMLAGNSTTNIVATVKWDGAPAIFAGIDPRDGKFFVAKKGVFNKTPKLYKTPADVDEDTKGSLATKLKIALQHFNKLGIESGVYQGDLMFTKSDLKTETIDGQKYTTFHPNTIVYAVPYNTELGKKIRSAQIGVVWHTKYIGSNFEDMKAVYGESIAQQLKTSSSVWMDDATYKDYSGTATFTKTETENLTKLLSIIGKKFNQIPAATINGIKNDPDLLLLVKTYNNSLVRTGEKINPIQHVDGLFKWIYDKFQKEIETKKTSKGKQSHEEKRKKILAFFANHSKDNLIKIFELSNLIADAKAVLIAKMNQANHLPTFIQTDSGFKITGVEGFVAIDKLDGGAVKLVDRMEFSKNNFSPEIIKGWQR